MDQDKKICRLCLQIIGNDVPYSALTNNNVVLQHLNLVSFSTVQNLELVENSVICNSCDNKVKELAKFKETIIGNEFKIQCNQKTNVNIFLQTLSDDIEIICRLCLTTISGSAKNWHDLESLFSQCNIHMNVSISIPDKICKDCDTSLQVMAEFMSMCSENENKIFDFSNKHGKITSKNFFKLFLVRDHTSKKDKADRSNSLKVSTKNKQQKSSKERLDSQFGKKVYGKSSKSADLRAEDESFDVTRTVNTYKSKKMGDKKPTNPINLAEMPSTSQMEQPPKHLMDRESIMKKINEQILQMHTSIDAPSRSDATDITLDVDDEGLVQEEANSEYNATQELIDVLEGRLNDKTINYATQELLDVLEGGTSEDDVGTDIVVTVDVEQKPKKRGRPRKTVPSVEIRKNLTNDNNKQVKIINMVSIPNKKQPQKSVTKTIKPAESSSIRAAEKRTGLRQKTIVASFKEIFDKKLSKNDVELVENSTVTGAAKKISQTEPTTSSTNQTISGDTLKATEPRKKTKVRAKKKNDDVSDETGPPKKKLRKTPSKKPAAATESKGEPASVNEPSSASVSNTGTSSDDEFVEDDNVQKKFENRPVTVTIIKSKKRTNKAQLEKTWRELTGKPGSSQSKVNNIDIQGAVEIEVVRPKSKRGRPRMSEKSVKASKKEVIWLHCKQCAFKTYAQNSFVQHQLIHNVMSDVGTLHCDVCRFNTTNTELMTHHKASHVAPNLNYKCVFCDAIFKKKVSCMYHTLRHDDQDVASQFYCMVYNMDSEEEYFECYQCDYQNSEETPMPDHVIDHTIETPKHPDVAKFKCTQCLYCSKSEALLKRHMATHEAKEKVEKKKAKTKAKKDGGARIKEDPEGIKDVPNQSVTYQSLPLLKCDLCHYASRNKRSLINHKGLKHNFNRQAALPEEGAASKASKEGLPVYYCNECSYSTHRKLNMPRHALVHRTKENMEFLECPHCLFETKHRRSYTRHLEVLHGVLT